MRESRETIRRGTGTRITRLTRALTRVLVVACAVTFLGMGGCAGQGEGERCTFFGGGDAGENGTDECASGLLCVVTSYYATTTATPGVGTLGVCCPPSGSVATAAACQPTVGGSTTGGKPTGDGGYDGPLPDTGTDAHAHDATTSDAAKSDAAKSDAGKSDAPSSTSDGSAEASSDAKHGG